MANRHLIGKQVFEMEVNTSKNAYALQQKVSAILKNKLNPELEKVFDRIVGEEEVLQIEHLELNIGRIDPENLDELIGKVLNSLDRSLKENRFRKQSKRTDLESLGANRNSIQEKRRKAQLELLIRKGENLNSSFRTPHNNRSGKQDLIQQGYETLYAYYFKLWVKFLTTGALPSYAIQPEKDLINYALEALVLDNKAVERLRTTIIAYPIALDRLVLQHRTKDLVSLMELYTGHSHKRLPAIIKDFIKTVVRVKSKTKKFNQRQLEVIKWKQVLRRVIVDEEKLERSDVKAVLKKLTSREDELPDDKEDLQSPQFFKNAGVILLHPFLNTLFKQLGFLKGSTFKNKSSKNKAVLLLHFLATGDENIPEYEMVLPKLLCEIPSNLPLDHTLKISNKEKKEALNLLKVVIEHWGALGSTSPEGLQEGFLRREGKLEKEQMGWKLYVEQKTIDILLDRLPWNLSMIKLPWMNEILKVEWR